MNLAVMNSAIICSEAYSIMSKFLFLKGGKEAIGSDQFVFIQDSFSSITASLFLSGKVFGIRGWLFIIVAMKLHLIIFKYSLPLPVFFLCVKNCLCKITLY